MRLLFLVFSLAFAGCAGQPLSSFLPTFMVGSNDVVDASAYSAPDDGDTTGDPLVAVF